MHYMMTDPLASLQIALLQLDPRLATVNWIVLSGGRTNRLWRVGDYTVKQFDSAASSPLFPNDVEAEARALALFSPLGIAPRLRAVGADWLIYDYIEGSAWSSDPAPVARVLHRLHKVRLAADSFRAAPNGSAAVLVDAQRIFPMPDAPADPCLGPVAPAPIHADAVVGNVLQSAAGPVLIDWQCPAMGDPVEDICTFISPAMSWLYSGTPVSSDWVEAFWEAYPDSDVLTRARAMQPLYRWRIAAYCAWKVARGDVDYAQALKLELAI